MATNVMMEPIWFTPAPIRGRYTRGLWSGGGSAPAPDPAIGEAAKANAKIGQEALDFSKQQYEENKPIVAKYQDLADQYVKSQSSLADTQTQIGQGQWKQYQDLFMPLNQKVVSDATNYDSTANQEKMAGMAGGDVGTQFGLARKNLTQQLSDQGVDPNSGKYAGALRSLDIGQAGTAAGAETAARQNTIDKGIALRAGASNLGAGLPNTASNALMGASNTTSAATSTAGSAITAANQGAAPMYTGYGTAISGNNAAGNLYLGQYNAQMAGYNANQQANAGMWGGIGTGVGMLFGRSSKKLKTNKKPLDHAMSLAILHKTPVESWRYKPGVEDSGAEEHVGPYAEDMKKNTGRGDGKKINLMDEIGLTMSAVKGLADKVDKIEANMGLAKKGARK